MQATKHASEGVHPGFETKDRCQQKSITGVLVAPQQGLDVLQKSKKNLVCMRCREKPELPPVLIFKFCLAKLVASDKYIVTQNSLANCVQIPSIISVDISGINPGLLCGQAEIHVSVVLRSGIKHYVNWPTSLQALTFVLKAHVLHIKYTMRLHTNALLAN